MKNYIKLGTNKCNYIDIINAESKKYKIKIDKISKLKPRECYILLKNHKLTITPSLA